MPARNKKALLALLVPLFFFLPFIAWLVVSHETPFNDHEFELGTEREFQGIYFSMPQPLIILDEAFLPEGHDKEAILLGYGKFGAQSTIRKWMANHGNFEGKRIRIRGTLLRGDQKILIELTQGENALRNVERALTYPIRQTPAKAIMVKGEIIDPKCWFGAMKPGEGKVHKSCAIRCISGGIPPVLKVPKNNGHLYYLLETPAGEDMHQSLLEFVAEPVEVSGEVFYQNGWNVIKTSAKKIRYLKKAS